MYIQMTWPGLFTKLQTFIDPTRLTYPSYHKDSKSFLALMEDTLQRAARATQRHQSRQTRSVIDCMRNGTIDDTTEEEIKTETFALLRAGNE